MNLRERLKEFMQVFDETVAGKGGRDPELEHGFNSVGIDRGYDLVTPPHCIPAVQIEAVDGEMLGATEREK